VRPGELIGPLEVGPVAHGGHFVARLEGRVVFVRHALPGELVTARVTEVSSRFARADAVELITVSPERVVPPCPNAGVCGGCDFQHVRPAFQAELKRQVLAEQLQRLAGITWDGVVEQVPPVLGSRTRMRFVDAGEGRLGLRAHRSHVVVPLPGGGCPIADPSLPMRHRDEDAAGAADSPAPSDLVRAPGQMTTDFDPASPAERAESRNRSSNDERLEYLGVVSREGGALFRPGTRAEVTQRVGDREFAVSVDGFWQSHPAAPDVLSRAVLDGLAPAARETAFDLYCGVGVFAAALVDAGCRVWGLEGDRRAVELARRNVADARFFAGDVARTLRRLPRSADLVVLDPPRTGAGKAVITAIAGLRPRAVAYVACDPAALSRDLGTARQLGLEAVSVRAFDLFGMTHHLEAVAILRPA